MKRVLEVFAIVEDLKAGLTDDQLMVKYNLSDKTLRQLLDRLARAYACGSNEIDIDE